MLYIFDKDGTLVGGVDKGNGKSRPANTPSEQALLPGVAEKISQLRAEGHQIAIASNQGGVAWGFMTEAQAQSLIDDCIGKIGGVDAWAWCPCDPKAAGKPNSVSKFACESNDRKPNPGMIHYCLTHVGVELADTVFVGDMESDKQAAENAGVAFVWAKDFFFAD